MTVINKYIWLTTRVHSISFFLSPLGFFFIHLTHKNIWNFIQTIHNTHTHSLTYFRFLNSDSVIVTGMTFRCVLNVLAWDTKKWVLLHYNFSSVFSKWFIDRAKIFLLLFIIVIITEEHCVVVLVVDNIFSVLMSAAATAAANL